MLELSKNSFGRLVFGKTEVVPIRAFPVTSPRSGISLADSNGKELAWIENLDDLEEGDRKLVEEALQAREFLPEILRLSSVSRHAAPCEWRVETDKGKTAFTLDSEDDIRRVSSHLVVTDSHGVSFLIKDPAALDRHSRRLLASFL
jgi:hypothetical protein